jgi:predicted transposase YbfD/YdcC
MHTQRDLAQWLVEDKNAHYLFVIKDNQPTLLAQAIAATTGTDTAFRNATDISTSRGHGRTEKRSVRVAAATGVDFPHAAQIVRIRRDRGGLDGVRTSKEVVYAVTDLHADQAGPAQLATYARGHWGIENKLHYVRDVTYREDASQIRSGTGPRIMATLRNLAISTLQLAGRTEIAKSLRHNNRDASRPLAMLGITVQT